MGRIHEISVLRIPLSEGVKTRLWRARAQPGKSHPHSSASLSKRRNSKVRNSLLSAMEISGHTAKITMDTWTFFLKIMQ